MSVALKGNFIEKMNESIRFAEQNRARVGQVTAEIRETVLIELSHRYKALDMQSNSRVAVVTESRAADDPRFKVAIANEQWGSRLATMYALAELVAAQREANHLAQLHLGALQDNNALQTAVLSRLNELISLLDVREEPEYSNVTVPQPRPRT